MENEREGWGKKASVPSHYARCINAENRMQSESVVIYTFFCGAFDLLPGIFLSLQSSSFPDRRRGFGFILSFMRSYGTLASRELGCQLP